MTGTLVVKLAVLVSLIFFSLLAGLLPVIISGAISLFYRASLHRSRRKMTAVPDGDHAAETVDHWYHHYEGHRPHSIELSQSQHERHCTPYDSGGMDHGDDQKARRGARAREPAATMLLREMQSKIKSREAHVQRAVMKALDVCQGFAGGVLLSAGLMHLLPESMEVIAANLEALYPVHDDHGHGGPGWFIHYPWAPALLCISLVLLIFVEDVLVSLFTTAGTKSSKRSGSRDHDDNNGIKNGSQRYLEKPLIAHDSLESLDHDTDGSLNNNNNSRVKDDEPQQQQLHQDHVDIHVGDHDYHDGTDSMTDDEDEKAFTSKLASAPHAVTMMVSGVVLWFSLTLHSFFEGLALGAQNDEKKMWSIFIAIVSHKLVESFALGLVLKESFRSDSKDYSGDGGDISSAANRKKRKKFVVMILLIFLFSIATPLGIGVGIAVSTVNQPWFLILQSGLLAFACGAFIHVSLEILHGHSHFPEQDHNHSHNHSHSHGISKGHWDNVLLLCKYILFGAGFVVMALLPLLH